VVILALLSMNIKHVKPSDPKPMLQELKGGLRYAKGEPTIVALTKADKLTKADARENVAKISRTLALEPDQVIQFSAQTGEGRIELLEAITQLVEKV